MKTQPIRIQRKRTKGWRMPPNTKCVTRPGKWGNPFPAGCASGPSVCVAHFKVALVAGLLPVSVEDARRELCGFNLACYCPIGSPCHADVLLEIANS